jgi:hypothetical protein
MGRFAIGKNISSILPYPMFFIGDAGYTLFEYLITPFDRTQVMDNGMRGEAKFNYYHS